jgi:hypothetical protein
MEVLNEDEDLVGFAAEFAVFGGSVVEDLDDELIGEVLEFHFGEFGSVFEVFEGLIEFGEGGESSFE